MILSCFTFFSIRFPPLRGVGKPDKRHYSEAGEKQRKACCISCRHILCDNSKHKSGKSKCCAKSKKCGLLQLCRATELWQPGCCSAAVLWKQCSPKLNFPRAWHALYLAIMCVSQWYLWLSMWNMVYINNTIKHARSTLEGSKRVENK